MTREEAIDRLIEAKKGYKVYLTDEAIDMAIKALELEVCEDCISRQAVLVAMRNNYRDGSRDIDGDYVEGNYSEKLYDAIMSLPPVTPQPKIGKWIPIVVRGQNSYCCSECLSECCYAPTAFCPDCGCKMVESEDDKV